MLPLVEGGVTAKRSLETQLHKTVLPPNLEDGFQCLQCLWFFCNFRGIVLTFSLYPDTPGCSPLFHPLILTFDPAFLPACPLEMILHSPHSPINLPP